MRSDAPGNAESLAWWMTLLGLPASFLGGIFLNDSVSLPASSTHSYLLIIWLAFFVVGLLQWFLLVRGIQSIQRIGKSAEQAGDCSSE